MIAGVEGKTVFYEINGQRYSYDTNSRQQVAAARKRIDAANAADAAKAKAEAERAGNPLAALFGSQIQQEAAQAQARLEQVIAEQEQASAARKREREQGQQNSNEKQDADLIEQKPEGIARETEREQVVAAIPASPPEPSSPREQNQSDKPSEAAVKSVTLDAETGIKTIIRTDGSISEELFDRSILSKLDLDRSTTNSTTKALDQADKAPRVDATGSTNIKGARLSPNVDTSSQRSQ
jgi:hypothetical protein